MQSLPSNTSVPTSPWCTQAPAHPAWQATQPVAGCHETCATTAWHHAKALQPINDRTFPSASGRFDNVTDIAAVSAACPLHCLPSMPAEQRCAECSKHIAQPCKSCSVWARVYVYRWIGSLINGFTLFLLCQSVTARCHTTSAAC